MIGTSRPNAGMGTDREDRGKPSRPDRLHRGDGRGIRDRAASGGKHNIIYYNQVGNVPTHGHEARGQSISGRARTRVGGSTEQKHGTSKKPTGRRCFWNRHAGTKDGPGLCRSVSSGTNTKRNY